MNKLYKLLLITALISFLYTLSTIMIDVIDMSIPNLKATIEVEDWDKDKNIADVYADIKTYAQNNNLDIHKIVFATDKDSSPIKKVFTFAKDSESDYYYDRDISSSKVDFYDSSELSTENIIGSYALTTAPSDNLEKDFANLGLTVKIEKFQLSLFMLGSLFTTIGVLSLVLFSATIVSSFVSKAARLKKYGIWEINGKSTFLLGFKDFIYDSLIITIIFAGFAFFRPILVNYYIYMWFCFVLCFFLLNIIGTVIVNRQETIVEKIKGKRPYQLYMYVSMAVKVFILIFFIITFHETVKQINESKEIYQGLSMWEQIDDYYQLYFSNTTTLLPTNNVTKEDFEKAGRKLYPLLENAEKNNGILAMKGELQSISALDHSGSNPLITINHNFLDVIAILDKDGNKIAGLSENKFYCLIPENHKSNEAAIINEVRSWIYFNQDISGAEDERYEGELEIVYIKSNQKIFNFNSEDPQNTFSKNPIIVLAYLQGLGSQIENLIAEMSQGHYLFHDLEEINRLISENGLENEFFGLVSAKDLGMEILRQVKQEYKLKVMALLFLFVVFIIIQFFISYSHIEIKKKKLFLQYIFGKNFWYRHHDYLKNMFLIIILTSLGAFLINSNYLYIIAGAMVFEIVLLFSTTIIAERFVRLSVIKKGE